MILRRGDVVYVALDPTLGSEMRKTRPCVVVQRDAANQTSPTVIVCPLTDANGSCGNLLNVPISLGIGGKRKPSLVVCNQIRTVDMTRILRHVGTLPPEIMVSVDQGLRAILDLGSSP